jgi:hypothetical protein
MPRLLSSHIIIILLITTIWSCNSTESLQQVSITHIWECCGDSNKFKPCKVKPDNTAHVSHEESTSGNSLRQQSKSQARSHISLVHAFHAIPLQGIWGWLVHYPCIHHCSRGEVSSNSLIAEGTKFARPP